ncbi:MAG TPA: PilZ domain-containing protein [Polyangia bacterium]|jgi:uncharacterized protein (TIGR02266 family)|nr:PilZ domain-containing protein [Polyangia bacterium]
MSTGAIEAGRTDWTQQQGPPRSGRAAVEMPVDLHGDEGPFSGVVHNISPEGLFLATERLAPVGERVMLLLAFPGERRPLAVRAEVRWARPAPATPDDRRPAGMGLRFVDPPLGVALSIRELIEAKRTDDGRPR